jgi:hypothetical protein
MALKEYKAGTTFPGVIGLTTDQSSPAWPEPLSAKEGTPNVLFIVLDDTDSNGMACITEGATGYPCQQEVQIVRLMHASCVP